MDPSSETTSSHQFCPIQASAQPNWSHFSSGHRIDDLGNSEVAESQLNFTSSSWVPEVKRKMTDVSSGSRKRTICQKQRCIKQKVLEIALFSTICIVISMKWEFSVAPSDFQTIMSSFLLRGPSSKLSPRTLASELAPIPCMVIKAHSGRWHFYHIVQ